MKNKILYISGLVLSMMFAILSLVEGFVLLSGNSMALLKNLFPSGETLSSALLLMLCGLLNVFCTYAVITEHRFSKYIKIITASMTFLVTGYFYIIFKFHILILIILLLSILNLIVLEITIKSK